MHCRQVAEGAALPLLIAEILPDSKLLAVEGQGCVQLAEQPEEGGKGEERVREVREEESR